MRHLFEAQRTAFVTSPPTYERRTDALRALDPAILARQRHIAEAVAEDFGGRPAEETLALELIHS